MRKADKRKKTKQGRLKRGTLCLALMMLALIGTAFGAYAVQADGLFSSSVGEDGGYRVSTKDGVTQNGETTPIANADGSKWVPASDSEDNNTYYLYLEGAAEGDDPVVTLVMDGNVWTYYFTVVDSDTAEYYVTEFINREGDYALTTDPAYQLVDEKGNVIYYTMTGSNGSVTLYNLLEGEDEPEFGDLTLTKVVQDAEGKELTAEQDATRFRFTISLSYTLVTATDDEGESEVTEGSAVTAALLTGSQTYGDIIIDWTSESTIKETDGGTVTTTVYAGSNVTYLAAGESLSLTGLPAGISYSVTEAETEGYSAAWTSAEGTIAADTELKAVCTNTQGGSGEEPEDTGTVIVKKQVSYADGTAAENNQGIFTMRLSLTGLKPGAAYGYEICDSDGAIVTRETEDGGTAECVDSYAALADGSADVSFTLMDGQYAVFSGLPVECRYQVMEDAAEGYTASYALSGGGDSPFYASSNGTNYEANQSLTTARETLDPEEAGDEVTPVTVTFTNTLPGEETGDEKLDVTVKKQWQNADGEDESAAHEGEEITIYLLRTLDPDNLEEGDVIGTAFLNGTDDGWTYTFRELERYTDGGQIYYYYIKEEAVSGYSAILSVDSAPCLDERGNLLYEQDENGDYVLDESGQKIAAYDGTKDYSFTVTNRTSIELPKTGGEGTHLYLLCGLALMAVPACLFGIRRRRERRAR